MFYQPNKELGVGAAPQSSALPVDGRTSERKDGINSVSSLQNYTTV